MDGWMVNGPCMALFLVLVIYQSAFHRLAADATLHTIQYLQHKDTAGAGSGSKHQYVSSPM